MGLCTINLWTGKSWYTRPCCRQTIVANHNLHSYDEHRDICVTKYTVMGKGVEFARIHLSRHWLAYSVKGFVFLLSEVVLYEWFSNTGNDVYYLRLSILRGICHSYNDTNVYHIGLLIRHGICYLYKDNDVHHLGLSMPHAICYSYNIFPNVCMQFCCVVVLVTLLEDTCGALTHLPGTKWLPVHMRHFQMHFLDWKVLYTDSNFPEVCS